MNTRQRSFCFSIKDSGRLDIKIYLKSDLWLNIKLKIETCMDNFYMRLNYGFNLSKLYWDMKNDNVKRSVLVQTGSNYCVSSLEFFFLSIRIWINQLIFWGCYHARDRARRIEEVHIKHANEKEIARNDIITA